MFSGVNAETIVQSPLTQCRPTLCYSQLFTTKTVRGNSCRCSRRTSRNGYVIHASWHRFDDARQIGNCVYSWHNQHSVIVWQAVFLRVIVNVCRWWTGGQQCKTIQCLMCPSCCRPSFQHMERLRLRIS